LNLAIHSLTGDAFTNALLDNQSYKGFSMLLDIPHAPAGEKTFDLFMDLAVRLSGQLGLDLVNDKMEEVSTQWLKDIAPSAELRRWYHAAPQERFPEFAARYTEELQSGSAHTALLALKKQLAADSDTVLLTAVRCPQQSHLSVLAEVLGWEKVDWGDGA